MFYKIIATKSRRYTLQQVCLCFVCLFFFSRVYANETEYKFSCIVFYVELLVVVALHLTIYLRRHAKVKKNQNVSHNLSISVIQCIWIEKENTLTKYYANSPIKGKWLANPKLKRNGSYNNVSICFVLQLHFSSESSSSETKKRQSHKHKDSKAVPISHARHNQ